MRPDSPSLVLTEQTVQHLAHTVPESAATQSFLTAAVSTHAYRNKKFGPSPEVAKSLWKGLSIWRRWRQYIQLVPELKLTTNFISMAHYMTEELLVHAAINHPLTLHLIYFLTFLQDYSLRNTGNRGIEAFHSIFRGGTTTLPIIGEKAKSIISVLAPYINWTKKKKWDKPDIAIKALPLSIINKNKSEIRQFSPMSHDAIV